MVLRFASVNLRMGTLGCVKSFTPDKFVVAFNYMNKLPNHFLNMRRNFCRQVVGEREETVLPTASADYLDENKEKKEIFQKISNGSEEKLKALKLLDFEIAVLKNEGCRVPDKLNLKQWEELSELPSFCQRRKFLAFLRLNELKDIGVKEKSLIKRKLITKAKEEKGFHYYGLSGHTMFLRIYDSSLNTLLDLRRFMQPSVHVIFDLSYQEYMSKINVRNCARQLQYCVQEARIHRSTCKVDVCNYKEDDMLGQELPKFLQNFDATGWNFNNQNYIDLYPKEKLVYLSPHAKDDLKFNPEDIFIIGAFVDKGNGVKASLAKAKQNKVRCAKFPIDRYLNWRYGTKSLPLNTCLRILLEMNFYRDWNRAFKQIPTRCLNERQSDRPKRNFFM